MTFLLKLATVMAFFVALLVICMLVKVISDQQKEMRSLYAENHALENNAQQMVTGGLQ